MPRKPTTDVIEHRITLGSWERERADELLNAIEFKQIASPIVDIISDKDAIAVILVLLAALGGIAGITLGAGLAAILFNKYGEQLGDAADAAFRTAVNGFWDGILQYTTIDEAYYALTLIYDQYEMKVPTLSSFVGKWARKQIENITPVGSGIGGFDVNDLLGLLNRT